MFWLLAPLAVATADAPIRINDLVMIGTHNSYKLAMPAERMEMLRKASADSANALDYTHRPIVEQLDAGARQLELDIWYDPKGGLYADGSTDPAMQRPGFKVQHMAGFDNRSNCVTLVQCLTIIRAWSDAHPGHVPILLMFNTNDNGRFIKGEPYSEAAYDALDAEVRSVLAPSKLIVPDDVQGNYPTLREAVLANNWPTLEGSRGKFLFALDETPAKVALYRGARKSLEGRVFFVNTDEQSPAAAYLTLNEPVRDADRIARAVKANFLVRTRADANTREARTNDTGPRDAAFKSGAQYISTDYLWPDPRFAGGYRVTMPGGAVALCNPVRRPQGCGGAITEPTN
ncbi:phosphatidylinositol-specific phospholipase C1-like protein [Sphingomonas sp. BT-65]|uniref:phosphatidylinositol-specific phospholipase C1-like protein n=1 Tax=Sphingomonas sp. BT-65 TaxID=2989821 RepID=UPI00223620F4|nr:phosphatidylinositol-specific phospholipase C1-like protein [Sphingomonas sp. BT-65]MCW4463855.1 phosphatidylinositol-specific phospholipase C1-like protein [Sphingomonas sp. BT-65]